MFNVICKIVLLCHTYCSYTICPPPYNLYCYKTAVIIHDFTLHCAIIIIIIIIIIKLIYHSE